MRFGVCTNGCLDQSNGDFPKGAAEFDLDGGSSRKEILVIPKPGDIWTATYAGDSMKAGNRRATPISMPGATTRRKMDNAWVTDLDGDFDVVTTEENGRRGLIWFENPLK